MYDIYHNIVQIPYFSVVTNDAVYSHNTRQSHNLHRPIDHLSTVEKHIFFCTIVDYTGMFHQLNFV